jgi:hypothetical protein
MYKETKMRYTIFFTLMLGIFATTGFNIDADILFQDDFERLEIDLAKWAPQVSWGITDNDTRHDVLGRKVLDVWGGGVGLSLADFPEEFDYYADFKTMEGTASGSVARFVFHAQEGEVDPLRFVGAWTDNEKRFARGRIGFSMGGNIEWGWGERAQFDNILVTTPGFLSVAPRGKLPLTWGELKHV